jgi:hypothetical protein
MFRSIKHGWFSNFVQYNHWEKDESLLSSKKITNKLSKNIFIKIVISTNPLACIVLFSNQ